MNRPPDAARGFRRGSLLRRSPTSVTSSRASSVATSASEPVLFVCVCLVVRGPLTGGALLVLLSWFGKTFVFVFVLKGSALSKRTHTLGHYHTEPQADAPPAGGVVLRSGLAPENKGG